MGALVRSSDADALLRLADEAACLPEGAEGETFAITREQAQAIAQLAADHRRLRGLVTGQKTPCVLFHGVWGLAGRGNYDPGHYLYTCAGRTIWDKERAALGVPKFARQLDGGYAPGSDELGNAPRYQPERLVRVTHEAGWTLYAFWDRSADERGNSNSVILIEGTWEFGDLEPIASRALPQIWARCGSGLREETPGAWRALALGGEF